MNNKHEKDIYKRGKLELCLNYPIIMSMKFKN